MSSTIPYNIIGFLVHLSLSFGAFFSLRGIYIYICLWTKLYHMADDNIYMGVTVSGVQG